MLLLEISFEIPRQEAVNESWQSVEQDTSQVSVSSLPEDEKSEPSSVTVSSATTTTGEQPAVAVSITDEPKMEMIVEQRGNTLRSFAEYLQILIDFCLCRMG